MRAKVAIGMRSKDAAAILLKVSSRIRRSFVGEKRKILAEEIINHSASRLGGGRWQQKIVRNHLRLILICYQFRTEEKTMFRISIAIFLCCSIALAQDNEVIYKLLMSVTSNWLDWLDWVGLIFSKTILSEP